MTNLQITAKVIAKSIARQSGSNWNFRNKGKSSMGKSAKINRMAMISFVSGLIVFALLGFGIYWQSFPASLTYANTIRIILDLSVSVQYLCVPVALLTGILALKQIQRKDGAEKSKIFAWIGIFLGACYLLFGLLVLIIFSAQFLS